jgi:putative Mn2+ efflux pump MntP
MNNNFKKYKIFIITTVLIAVAFGIGVYFGKIHKNK